MKRLPTLLLLVFATCCLWLSAHEFYLLPQNFRPAPGSAINIAVLVGEYFAGDPWDFASYPVTALREVRGKKMVTKPTADVGANGFVFTPTAPDTYLFALQTGNKYLEMEPGPFLDYLKEDGLENAIALREEKQQTQQPSKEFYARCAKTLLQVGTKRGTAYRTNTGMPLEIIPQQNPYGLQAGEKLTCQLLFRNRPLVGAKVRYWNRQGPAYSEVQQRSDDKGRVSFALKPGPSLISVVVMEPTPAGSKADWQSWWGSYTFGL